MLKRLVALLLLSAMLVIALASCGFEGVIPSFSEEEEDRGELYSEMQEMVSISVMENSYFSVSSSNPIRVMRGADASFKLEFKEGYDYLSSSDGAVYENGYLTLRNVQYPTTLKVTPKRAAVTIGGNNNGQSGGSSAGGLGSGGSTLPEGFVKVTISEGVGYTILSSTEVYVMEGECASFKISFNSGYQLDKVTGGTYHNGYVTTGEVYKDTTVTVKAKEKTAAPTHETIVLTEPAAPEGMHFVCWTVKRSLQDGGEVITTEPAGTFEIPIGSTVYPNFVDDAHHLIVYRLNGGKTIDGKNYYCQLFSNEHFEMPNTISAADGLFVREGYTMLRYTEKEDGSGEYTTLGGKIVVNENGFVELWVQWAEQNDTYVTLTVIEEDEQVFTTDSSGNEVSAGVIKGPFAVVSLVMGSESRVVIPESVDYYGKTYPVKKIAAGAITKHKMRELVLPDTIEVIEDGAVTDCMNLWTLTMYDSVRIVSDDSFSGCDALKTCYLNAKIAPTTYGEAMFSLKYERLRMAYERGEKKILLVSGSSSLYGFSARQMQEAFDNEYTVINYGTNAGAGSTFYMDVFTRFLTEGDILLHAPETTNTSQLGDAKFYRTTFRGCIRMLEVFSYADLRYYEDFFDAYCDYVLNQREGFTTDPKGYEGYSKFIDEYSDMYGNVNNPNYETQGTGAKPCNIGLYTDARVRTLNRICSNVRENGAEMYFTFGPINHDCIHQDHLSRAKQLEFMEALQGKIDYTLISDIADYILERELFNNSDHHPGIDGCRIRTERLTADLKAQLAKEGK